MVFAAARRMKIFVVDYRTFNIVQTFELPDEVDRIHNGLEFSIDGHYLYAHYCVGGWYVIAKRCKH